MLSIRSGTPDDVPLLKTFLQEFARYERLSAVITEEQLRQDGFWSPAEISRIDCGNGWITGGLCTLLRLLFVASGPRHFFGRPLRPTTVS
jgi:hypothetical protein